MAFFKPGKVVSGVLMTRTLLKWWQDRARQEANEGKFMGDKEVKALLSPKHAGLVLGGSRLSHDQSFRNSAIIAATGAGKTANFIIPNLLALDDVSIVATDPFGKLFEQTSGDLARRGYRVLKLDPTHLDASIGYNPLSRVKDFSSMTEIAHILVKTANHGSAGSDPFWVTGAQEILGILVKCLTNHVDAHRYANLANLQYLLNCFGDGEPLLPFVAGNAPDDSTYFGFKGFISQSEKTMQGILSQAKVALSSLSDPDIARLTEKSTFEFADLRRRKTALFVCFPQNRVSYYSFLVSLFFTELFHFAVDPKEPKGLPIYALFDEFGHFTVPSFSSIVTTTRQHGVSINIVLQALSQLEERYGREAANTILQGGIASQVYFSGMDIQTAEILAKTLGDKHSERVDSLGQVRTEREPLMSPAALRAMPDNQAVYVFANKRPMILDLKPYYADSGMRKRTERAAVRTEGIGEGRVEYVPLR
jgi:type IV secretion system protein VirD4